ncbi:MAG: NCS2 family permease [candidate division NC10 bacterium]|nr:NCS2 family permease [candidate division NC10 bacterium]MBI4391208.1 NCS2 family permease [candidate division NC10 bacterium]
MLERLFRLREHGTSVGTEVLAGLTTFMVMAYIIFVNPSILSFAGIKDLQGLGPPFAPTLAATCLVAGAMTILMGVGANYPLAIASGMGLNAVVAFQLVAGMRLPWPAAMGVIFIEGVLIALLVLSGFREAVMDAIPLALKRSISVGIGLFILFIGLVSGGYVKPGTGIPVTLGDFASIPTLVAVVGLLLTALLMVRRVKGALLLGILLTTAVAIVLNALSGSTAFSTPGVAVIPKRIVGWPDFSTLGQGVNLTVFVRLGVLSAVLTIFSIMLADFFDTMGTVIGIGGEAGWLDARGKLPRLKRVLFIDSLGAVFGGAASSSSATTYIESAAGVSEGGKTGLTSVVTGCCFFLALFFAPVAGIVPAQATSAALIVVGFLMCAIVKDIPFHDFEEGFPALMTIVFMPFTYSITNGIGAGFITYAFLKVARGKAAEVHWMLFLAAGAFLLYFVLPVLKATFAL